MKRTAIILVSEVALPMAVTLQQELTDADIYTKNELKGCTTISSYSRFMKHCAPLLPKGQLNIILIDEEGHIIGGK